MEHAERPITTRETVLLIADAVGDPVPGRTVMQKLAYFASIGLGTTLGHRAYYYGPYSSKIEDALSVASVAGELHETVERLPDWSGGPDILKYTYALTDDGRRKAEQVIAEAPGQWDRISYAVHSIRATVPDFNQKMLSSAAKTYLIISDSPEETSEEDIPELASRLGWTLTAEQVTQTVDLLQRLGLVVDDDADD